LMTWSTARTQPTVMPYFSIASATTRAKASLFDGSGDGLSVQLMIKARISSGLLAQMFPSGRERNA